MQIPLKKLKCGFELPVFGFGTWQMGGRETRDPANDDRADVFAIKSAIDMGITHIDTAAWYSGGHTEELVGLAIKGFDRSRLIITTKVPPMDLHYDDVIKSARGSLKRLGTDYIDVYVIHNPNPYIDIKESMNALNYLVEKQIAKFIGLSNFNAAQFSEAQDNSDNKIVCNHLHYNLKHRGPLLDGTIKYSQENDVLVVAWRPVQKGLFSKEKFSILEKLCSKYGKTENQIAINWLISQDNIVTISKTRNIGHLKENIDAAAGWNMEKEDIDYLMDNFPGVVETVENATLANLIEPE
ncbi:MAG: General stress protein 69 [Actinobacteria bacterium ADurb.Bin346]|nr:MAG: General stress protein 69 [Actinobacteria bacterium ADurb.Bin346]